MILNFLLVKKYVQCRGLYLLYLYYMGEQTHSKYVEACFYGAFSSFTSFLRHFVHVYANNKQRGYKG